MESEARYLRVGIVTLVLFALLSAGIFWLTGGAGDAASKRFVVHFEKQSLEGLQINSNVRMRGINVGKVVDYAIVGGGARKVRVLVQVDARTPVLQGAKAVITRNLVTGLAAIDLENPPDGSTPLTAVADGERYPQIPEGVPQLTRVADTIEELGDASLDALGRVNDLLSDDNRRALSQTLGNLSNISGELRTAMPRMSSTLSSLQRAGDGVESLSGEARVVLRSSGTQIERLAGEASRTLELARGTMQRVDQQVGELAAQMKLTTDLGGQEIQSTAQSLRFAGDALQETGRALANPARVLYGPHKASLGPGEEL